MYLVFVRLLQGSTHERTPRLQIPATTEAQVPGPEEGDGQVQRVLAGP